MQPELSGQCLAGGDAADVGSTPTADSSPSTPLSRIASAMTKGLDTDWIVKGMVASPAA